MKALEPIKIGTVTLKNRILRSATYEGRCDEEGSPRDEFCRWYRNLAESGVGGVITGFAYTSKKGRAMHKHQAGLDTDDKIMKFTELTRMMHRNDCPVFIQISHAGRQTTSMRAGGRPQGCSARRSFYFRSKPQPMSTGEVYEVAEEYARAAERAMLAGFDGVQIHAAHGYLVHQFLLSAINNRTDEFGIDPSTGIGSNFLRQIIFSVRRICGPDFPVLVKISGGTDLRPVFSTSQFRNLVLLLDQLKVDAIEVSYGTMDHPLNIFRGEFPVEMILRHNPYFNSKDILMMKLNRMLLNVYYNPVRLNFSPAYNLPYAGLAKRLTKIPVICVGGFRSLEEINYAIQHRAADAVGMSRPFLCEPDLMKKITKNKTWDSECVNCNECAVMCDSGNPTQCYQTKKRRSHGTFTSSNRYHQPKY